MNTTSSMGQEIVRKLTEIVYANLEEESFGVDSLARLAGMSRYSINRYLKAELKKTTTQFIRELRLYKAMEMLQAEMATAAEISYKVGFNSPTYFNSCFHHYFGYPPGEVRKRFTIDRNLIQGDRNNNPESEFNFPFPDDYPDEQQNFFSRKNFIVIATVLVVFLSLTFFWYFLFFKDATMSDLPHLKQGDKTLVVLPFKNLSDNPKSQYFADGMMEDILNQLFKIKELQVISRTTGNLYRNRTESATEISHKLGVNFILEGSIQQHDDKVRIIVQLIDARRDRHIWSEKYDRELADVFMIQSSIAKQIADQLEAALTANELERINQIPTKNMEAYTLYLQGRFNFMEMSLEGLRKSITYFEMAIAADPKYALAYVGLAEAYYFQAWWGFSVGTSDYLKSKTYILTALDLDPKLAEAHSTYGAILWRNDWNWMLAQQQFALALELNPNSSRAHQNYSEFLDIMGNNSQARFHINMALKLDPVSPVSYLLSARYYYHEGKFAESLECYRKAEQINGAQVKTAMGCLANFYWLNDSSAAAVILKDIVVAGTFQHNNSGSTNAPQLSGINSILRFLISTEQKKQDPQLVALAKWCVMAGKNFDALHVLTKAFQAHSPELPEINNDLDFLSLRRESRYKEIIKKMGLVQLHTQIREPIGK